jgi:hypothetical protein
LAGSGTLASASMLKYYAALSFPDVQYYQLLLDDSDYLWMPTASQDVTSAWLGAFYSRTAAGSDAGALISGEETLGLKAFPLPDGVSPERVTHIVSRWNRTLANWRSGVFEPSQAPPGSDTNFISMGALGEVARRIIIAHETARNLGHDSPQAAFRATVHDLAAQPEDTGVCARVKVRLEQDAVIARDGFRAVLELENNGASRLENVRVQVEAKDESGVVSTGLFEVRLEGTTVMSAVV